MPTALKDLWDQTPPSDIQAEKCLLGSLVIDPSRLAEVAAVVGPSDFHNSVNGAIFSTMLAMEDKDIGIDCELLLKQMEKTGPLRGAEGMAYLADVAYSTPVAQHVLDYAAVVATKAKYRRIITAAWTMLQAAYVAEIEVRDILDTAEQELAQIETGKYKGAPVKAADAANETMLRIYEGQRMSKSLGLPTGFETFDLRMGGLFAGELCVLAARTSVGKTALACQIAHYCVTCNRPVYFASLEMSAVEIMTRLMCGQANVDSREVRRAHLSRPEVDRLANAAGQWDDLPLWLHDRPGITVPEICRWARRLHRDGLSLVVVDYLQLLTPIDRKISRHEQLGQMTAALKALARELEIPILCVAQLSRKADESDSTEPRLSHLRESGSIEQDADMVLMLWKDPKDAKKDAVANVDYETMRLLVKKHRNGPTGFTFFNWRPERTMFSCGEF